MDGQIISWLATSRAWTPRSCSACIPDEDFLVGTRSGSLRPATFGISVYAKDENAATVRQLSWAVWERTNRPGLRRIAPRAAGGQETLVGFSPERLLDYAHFERRATELGLDPPLRYAAAVDAASRPPPGIGVDVMRHNLELNFDLSAHQILDIIQSRLRLTVAVNGGVAEYHLGVLWNPTRRSVRSPRWTRMHSPTSMS